jgi:PPK2 family polyphosphate:nucleotide phosphotransferase
VDFIDKIRVAPGSKVRLDAIDPGYTGGFDRDDGRAEVERLHAQITKLHRVFHGDKRHSLLIVLQGIDAAGKDGTCWNVIGAMQPMGVTITAFKQPTAQELAHDFLWRVQRHAPARGEVAVFNRSHYEDVLIARVHDLVPKDVWSKRYDVINEWESLIAREADTTILKFFLYISKEEQLERFKDRIDDPQAHWKLSAGDYAERARWDDYIEAFEAALGKCSTAQAPWYVIPSNKKWFRDLAVSAVIAQALEAMDLRYPEPEADIDEIRRLYRAEAEREGQSRKS